MASKLKEEMWTARQVTRGVVYTLATGFAVGAIVRKANSIGIPLQVSDPLSWGTAFVAGAAVPHAFEMLRGFQNFGRRLKVSTIGFVAAVGIQVLTADYVYHFVKGPLPFWATVHDPKTLATYAITTGLALTLGYKSWFKNYLREGNDE